MYGSKNVYKGRGCVLNNFSEINRGSTSTLVLPGAKIQRGARNFT